MPEFEVFAEADRFRVAVAELVDRDRVGATMLTAVLANQIDRPGPAGPPLLVALRDLDGLSVAALRMPGFPLLTVVDPQVRDRPATLHQFAAALHETGAPIKAVHGRREVALELAQAWSQCTGTTATPHLWLLYYRLAALIEPAAVPGAARPLDPQDPEQVALAARWFARFQVETGVSREPVAPDPELVARMIDRGDRFVLWWAGEEPVAVAGHSPVRADGICRIAPVYTPAQRRRERFGAAVTAAAVHSAWALGADEVTLFTDENYLPANELYRSLGFRPIAEFAEIDLTPAPAGH